MTVVLEGKSNTETPCITPQLNTMDSFTYECKRQTDLKDKFESEGISCVDDPAGLKQYVGTVQDITVFCEMFTPRLLAKLYVEGTTDIERAFHLVPVHQLVRWGYFIPKEGEKFTTKFVIGVRKVSDDGYVPALRLPL